MISGYFISVLGLAMLFPAALDVYDTGNSWSPFFSSSIIALFLGMSMFLANKIRIDFVYADFIGQKHGHSQKQGNN